MLMVVVIAGVAICLTVGIVLGNTTLVWCALAGSLVGAVAMLLLVLRRRKAASAATAAPSTAAPSTADSEDEPVAARAVSADPPPADPPPAGSGSAVSGSAGEKPDGRAPAPAGSGASTPSAEVVEPSSDAGDSGDPESSPTLDRVSTVLVVPGRQRFHMPDCRLLAGKPSEEIRLDEATEEGFSACTVCIPQRDLLSHI